MKFTTAITALAFVACARAVPYYTPHNPMANMQLASIIAAQDAANTAHMQRNALHQARMIAIQNAQIAYRGF